MVLVRCGALTSEDSVLVRPFAEVFFDRIEGADFTVSNAGAGNLAVRIHDRDGLRGVAGLQLAESYEGFGRVFRPSLEVGVAHQFEDAQSTFDVRPFGGGDSFRAYGVKLDRTSYVGKAVLDISLSRNATIALGYSGETAGNFSQHQGTLSVRMNW